MKAKGSQTRTALVDGGEDVGHVGHDLLLERLQVILRPHHQQLRAGDRGLQAVGRDLDALRRLHLLVVYVGALDAQLLRIPVN